MSNYINKHYHVAQQNIDIDLLAQKIAKLIQIPLNNTITKSEVNKSEANNFEEFNASKSMEKLADSMTIQRSGKNSNFEDLGNVQTTVKKNDEVDIAVDFLSGLKD